MHSGKEWPLIVFTILTQMAVGVFLVIEVIWRLGISRYDQDVVDALVTPVALMIIPLMVVGGMVATAHLARPRRAFRVMANLRNSWLSREMLLSGLFGVIAVICVTMRWSDFEQVVLLNIMALGAAISGIGLIIVISRLYMLRTVPGWNSAATPLSFLQTTLLLGSLGVSVAVAHSGGCLPIPSGRCALVNDILDRTVPTTIVLVGLQLALIALHPAMLTIQGDVAAESVRLLLHNHRRVFLLRLLLAVLTMGLLVVFIQEGASYPELTASSRGILIVTFAVAMLTEVLGRFLFYASYKRTGL